MPGTLAQGVYIQVYRAVVPGKTRPERLALLATKLDEWKAAGVVGVAFHGFYNDLDGDAFAPLAELCHVRGMKALAAYGLGPSHPDAVGKYIGKVAKRSDCDGALLDAEGAFDHDAKDATIALCKAIRDEAPDSLVGTQPWPVPTLHASFPYEEFATYTDFVAPQYYWADWYRQWGESAYDRCIKWFDGSWQKLEASMHHVLPRIATIQGYHQHYDHVLDWLVRCPTTFVWAEPFPDATVLAAIKSAHEKRCIA